METDDWMSTGHCWNDSDGKTTVLIIKSVSLLFSLVIKKQGAVSNFLYSLVTESQLHTVVLFLQHCMHLNFRSLWGSFTVTILCTSVLGICSSRDACFSDFCGVCLKPFSADDTVSASNPGLSLCGPSFTEPVSLNRFTHSIKSLCHVAVLYNV